MKITTAVLSLAAAASPSIAKPQSNTAYPPGHEWIAAGPNDFRGPCPMMNTLANHGFLPRDGRNITRENAILALGNGLNFNGTLAGIMWEQAIISNPTPNATFFTLDNLNRHNVLEHDASLSRSDAYFGNNHVFNQSVFDTSKAWWTESTVTAKMLANSKIYRQVVSRGTNPNYTFTASTEEFSLGEVAAPIIVFGDMNAGEVQRDLVEYFFENERLPTELGWQKKTQEVTLADITATTNIVRNATSLLTGAATSTAAQRRCVSDLHMGLSNRIIQ